MSKTLKRICFALVVIAAAILAVFAWKNLKKIKSKKQEDDEVSEIFEEEDFDFDDAV